MRFWLSLAFGTLLAACTPAIQPDEDTARMASSSASSEAVSSASEEWWLQPFDETAHSGSYTNAEYGFSLTYPIHFEPLKNVPGFSKSVSYSVQSDKYTFLTSEPMLSLAARDRQLADSTFEIMAYPDAPYSFNDIYNDELLYDPKADAWKPVQNPDAILPKRSAVAGRTTYAFMFGDAGHRSTTYVVPVPERQVVLEFRFSSCPSCGVPDITAEQDSVNVDHIDREMEAILSSMRFEQH